MLLEGVLLIRYQVLRPSGPIRMPLIPNALFNSVRVA